MSVLSGIASQMGKNIRAAIAPGATPPLPPGVDPRLIGMTDWMKTQRNGDLAEGKAFADNYFGPKNVDMQAILDARKAAAFGTDNATQLAREAGTEGINRSVQTALRQFAGRLPSTGVRGGAAGAMAGMLTRDAVGQSRGLERDLALNEMQRKQQALSDYEKSLTGERAGALGTQFGYAGLGSNDRYSSMGYLQGKDFLDHAQQAVRDAANPLGGGAGTPWWQKATSGWGNTPISSPVDIMTGGAANPLGPIGAYGGQVAERSGIPVPEWNPSKWGMTN